VTAKFHLAFQAGNPHERKIKEINYPHARAQIQFLGRSIKELVPEKIMPLENLYAAANLDLLQCALRFISL
jgi:hypothetical protein